MNTPQAEEVLKKYLEDNYAQIRDIATRQVVINAMHYFAGLALLEKKDRNMSMIKDIFKDENILLHTEAYLGEGDASTYFAAGARWMRDHVLGMV